ncbi:MAG: radical SAM protein [Terriglobales bacterium]
MSSLMDELGRRAHELGVPVQVHMDLTYRCNERCVHCYLDHDDHGEMTTEELRDLLRQLADAGVFFLTFSGGEVLMRMDFFPILEYACSLMFSVRIKSNAFMIREKEADRMKELGVHSVQVSIYSHRPEVHDAITKLPGSLKRSLDGIRRLRDRGLKVTMANVLMLQNMADHAGTKALAHELGAEYSLDPTVTPKMDGDRSIIGLGLRESELTKIFHDAAVVGDVAGMCAAPGKVDDAALDGPLCSASHGLCYISPYGDVYPCVQFPLPTGNVRKQKFIDIWRYSPEMNEVRSMTSRDLPVCSTCSHVASCTRCPGLAYVEGNMRGPSTQDCQKSFARTGIPTANMLARGITNFAPALVQISVGNTAQSRKTVR